jgi:hypothetical protein
VDETATHDPLEIEYRRLHEQIETSRAEKEPPTFGGRGELLPGERLHQLRP